MWENRHVRFPVHTPRTREYYLLRTIFDGHFPHADAIKTVPHVRAAPLPSGGGLAGRRGEFNLVKVVEEAEDANGVS
eukprot:scaffold21.g2080.t1